MLRSFLVNHFPALGKYKRFLVALKDNQLSIRNSYSQHREDVYILDLLKKYDLAGSVYVDIGANHPTDISNTYLLYRNGMHGIIIEPNEELADLFNKFRKRDTVLRIGCSNISAVLKFNISKTPVVSSFARHEDVNVYKSVYVPVMPVDDALSHLDAGYISFLSIDVEGLNLEVLEGAFKTLKKTLLLCIEYDTEEEKGRFQSILSSDFDFLCKFGCNMLYLNKAIHRQKILK